MIVENVINQRKQIIVISAINIISGGPFTILKNCLKEISKSDLGREYEIIALVYCKDNCYHDNITYIEFPKAKRRIYSYFMEYFGLKKLSINLKPLLWVSLTDKTPKVITKHLVVYLHNPTPFFKMRFKDFIYSPFLLLYVMFYNKVCSINIKKNDFIIVQQTWIRDAYTKMYKFPKDKCIVFPPVSYKKSLKVQSEYNNSTIKIFLFASLPRGFKNFEIICEANAILFNRGMVKQKIVLTLSGKENRYAKNIREKFGKYENISFVGVVQPATLDLLYKEADCLIFPSRLETWGLAISEFSLYNKPMLIADLPYAHNTAAGSKYVAFFNPYDANMLADYMQKIITNDFSFLEEVAATIIDKPFSHSWVETIKIIINDK
jgi:glycosyltransferase involved in cell wall biosynthesis